MLAGEGKSCHFWDLAPGSASVKNIALTISLTPHTRPLLSKFRNFNSINYIVLLSLGKKPGGHHSLVLSL